ncbi:MAG TPA: hypothetical protein VIW67_01395 [Terriglobales bacterium]
MKSHAASEHSEQTTAKNSELGLERQTFVTSRVLEYFTEKELTHQIGSEKKCWPLGLTKELIDNGLDAAEMAGVAPEIRVHVKLTPSAFRTTAPACPNPRCSSLWITRCASPTSRTT